MNFFSFRKYKKKICFIFVFNYLIFQISLFKRIKVCLCTIGKKENLYAREYVEHYKKKGVDKIFIYDNNNDEEKFETVLYDYINSGFVEIINFREINISPQIKAYNDCKNNNYKNFDYLIFYDMDEFIFLRNYENIKDFLSQKYFNKCEKIQLNWYFHTDNNLIYYDNGTLFERFPEKEKKWENIKKGGLEGVKSILKGNIDVEINDVHTLNNKLISCNGFGKIKNSRYFMTDESDHYFNYIDHFYTKSTEEFVNKLMRGGGVHGTNMKFKKKRIDIYFNMNIITLDKINYIENRTKFNLSKFRIRIKK